MANAGSVVALVFGAIFTVGGIWALVVYLECNAIFGGSFGGLCGTEETAAVFALVLASILFVVAIATWGRRPKARRRKAAAGGG